MLEGKRSSSSGQEEWLRTVLVVAYIHHSGADGQEENAVLLVLCVELGRDHVQAGLGNCVEGSSRQLEAVDRVWVCQAARNGNDLLDLALEDERDELVVQVDVANHVGLVQFGQLQLDSLGVIGSSVAVCLIRSRVHSIRRRQSVDSQGTDAIVGIPVCNVATVGDQVIEATASDFGSGSSGFLRSKWLTTRRRIVESCFNTVTYHQAVIVVQVALQDMDVRSVAQLRLHLLLSAGLVAYESDDGVRGIAGDLVEKLKLRHTVSDAMVPS